MSTKNPSSTLDLALANISTKLRSRIVKTYLDLKRNCVECRYEAAGLLAGKFCEIILRQLQHVITGSHVPFNKKIGNFPDECRKLITASAGTITESEKVIIPRALNFLYTMRNKRGIGHISGDVDANQIDTTVMSQIADWIICELIRIHHGMSLEAAQKVIDNISVRKLSMVWEVSGKKRVLVDGLNNKDNVLLLLYFANDSAVLVENLCSWIEYSNPSRFKNQIIESLHKERYLEHDKNNSTVILSPKGIQHVEEKIIKAHNL